MIKTPKKSLRLKNKRLLGELELTDHADTEQAVSADFNGDPNVMSNPHSSSVITATVNSYSPEESAQVDDLGVSELAKLVEEARLLEQKHNLKNELKTIYSRINSNNTLNNSGPNLSNQTSHAVSETTIQRSFKSKTLENCKLFQKIEVVRDPAVELRFFADRCKAYGITSDIEKFEILYRIWPRADIIDFVETHDEDRTYHNLIKFLQGKGTKLPRILGASPSWKEPVTFQELFLSAKQWAKAKEEDRVKYFMHKHAPNNLKNKIKECFGLEHDEFLRRTEFICDIEQQRVLENAKNFSYEPQRLKHNKIYPNKQKWHENVPHKREHFRSYEHNRSQGYFGEGYNKRTNYNQNALCHKHAKFGDRADYCAEVATCPMSPLRQQYDQKNEFPSSKQ